MKSIPPIIIQLNSRYSIEIHELLARRHEIRAEIKDLGVTVAGMTCQYKELESRLNEELNCLVRARSQDFEAVLKARTALSSTLDRFFADQKSEMDSEEETKAVDTSALND